VDLEGKNLWQVGAGDTERQYGDICLQCDCMVVGPGSPGRYLENLGEYEKQRDIRRFYDEAKKGDLVLLRLGSSHVLALGEIVDDQPDWLDEFADIDGWDLQHVRRVLWYPDTAKDFAVRTFGGQVNPFAAVHVSKVREWVDSLAITDEARRRRLRRLPQPGENLDEEELGRRLFIEGLPSEYIEKLSHTLESIRRVATWYSNKAKRPEGRPSEQETVAYLVLPLLGCLGWSQQTAAVEWCNIDVALFGRMPTDDKSLECVVEAKTMKRSVFQPKGQALSYALRAGRKNCRRLIVTDGIRYALYRRQANHFHRYAYLNVLRMRTKYPLLRCAGAVEAIMEMSRMG